MVKFVQFYAWILTAIMLFHCSVALAYPSLRHYAVRATRRSFRTGAYLRHEQFQYKDSRRRCISIKNSEVDSAPTVLTKERIEGNATVKVVDENSISNQKDPTTDELASTTQSTWISTTRALLGRKLRKYAGGIATATGFVASASVSLIKDRKQFARCRPLVQSFQSFLHSSGIELELSRSLNIHLLRNVVILGRIQSILSARDDPRKRSAVIERNRISLPPMKEAQRYMRYATAVYGETMIRAAEIHAKGKMDALLTLSPMIKARISEHIGVPEEDIVSLKVDYDEDDGHFLRHLVVVDHVNKKVVLALRGTFSLSEIVVDVAAFSRPCFGGEAHSEMMNMADTVWEAAGDTVTTLLRENDGYDLVLCGHSLGAGTAALLNIMLHDNDNKLVEGRDVQCFAYACPPVFTSLDLVPKAVASATNYINERDVVPFLSVDSVRHVFSCVRVIEDYMSTSMTRIQRIKLSMGLIEPDEELIQAVFVASNQRLKPKDGAPVLAIPAAATVWMREQPPGDFDYEVCDPNCLSTLGIRIDTTMADDHFPPRYEHAFENLKDP